MFGSSQVLTDGLELLYRSPAVASVRSHCVFQAMVNVVVHQDLLGLSDRLLDGMKLLRDVEARPTLLEHGYY
jgi:hypothetical protein